MSKILVAEDETAINKMICMNLNITGYETVSMQDGQEVLDYLATGASADLAIVDIMMPRLMVLVCSSTQQSRYSGDISDRERRS